MQVFECSVSFKRTRQPRDYETAVAEVAYKAALDENDDHQEVTQTLLADASVAVYETLGLQEAADRIRASGSEGSGATEKKGRGRPKGSKNKPKDDDSTPALEPEPEKEPEKTEKEPEKKPDDDLGLGDPDGDKDEVSDSELQQAASKAAQSKLGSAGVKLLLKEFGVSRLGELPKEKRREFLDRLDKAVEVASK